MFQGVPRWLIVFGIVAAVGIELISKLPELLLIPQKLAAVNGEYGGKEQQPGLVRAEINKAEADAQLARDQAAKAQADKRLADAQTTKTNLDSAGAATSLAILGAMFVGGQKVYEAFSGNSGQGSQQPVQKTTQQATQNPSQYEIGKAHWRQWHSWETSLIGDKREGALYWARVRSQRPQPSCTAAASGYALPKMFLDGCETAKNVLAEVDGYRLADPQYRQGWNDGAKETN